MRISTATYYLLHSFIKEISGEPIQSLANEFGRFLRTLDAPAFKGIEYLKPNHFDNICSIAKDNSRRHKRIRGPAWILTCCTQKVCIFVLTNRLYTGGNSIFLTASISVRYSNGTYFFIRLML